MRPATRVSLAAVVGGILGAATSGPLGATLGIAVGAFVGHLLAPRATERQKAQAAEALHSTASPEELRVVAKELDSAGLGAPLRVRADLIENPNPQNRSVLRVAASSGDVVVVNQAAAQLRRSGAHASARMLSDYARGLRALQTVKSEAVAATAPVQPSAVSAATIRPGTDAAPVRMVTVTQLSTARQRV